MAEHSLEFSFKARYEKIGTITARTRQVWFVIHGYGQLASYFIKKFSSLTEKNIVVIAPEGLSKYYLEDTSSRMQSGNNRVGANWMTRENRLTDIENYIRYLNAIYEIEMGGGSHVPVTILGFSQGAATASRWAADGSISFNRLILWAGMFPPDIDFTHGKQYFKNKEIISVYGKDDPFLNAERVNEMNALSKKLEVQPREISFEGKHELNEEVILSLAK